MSRRPHPRASVARRTLAVLAGCAALAATGCNRTPVVAFGGTQVRLTQSDYRIVPQRVRIEPGRVTFVVTDDAHLPHNWQLERDGRRLGRIATLRPGETGRITLRLRRGTYRMSCGVAHHEVLGEYGTVSVR